MDRTSTPEFVAWEKRSAHERLTRILPGYCGYALPADRARSRALRQRFTDAQLARSLAETRAAARASRRRTRRALHDVARRLETLLARTAPPEQPWLRDPHRLPDAALADLVYHEERLVLHVADLSLRSAALAREAADRLVTPLRHAAEQVERALDALAGRMAGQADLHTHVAERLLGRLRERGTCAAASSAGC
jgi:hypothetical protein